MTQSDPVARLLESYENTARYETEDVQDGNTPLSMSATSRTQGGFDAGHDHDSSATPTGILVRRPLQREDDVETSESHRRSTGSASLWASNARTRSGGDLGDNEQMHSDEAANRSQQLPPSRGDHKEAGYKTYLDRLQGAGSNKWAAETIALIMTMLALGGLVSTLLTHQSKPLPNWPQLVTINTITSLFSLIMRAGVGVVLVEGMLRL